MKHRAGPPTALAVVLAAVALAAISALWEVAARQGWISTLAFPPPSAIGTALRRLSGGELPHDLAASGRRLGAGLLIAVPCGLLAGWITGASRRLGWLANLALAAAHPIPKITLLPLLLLILGLGDAPLVAVVALAGFFPIAVSTAAGVRSTAAAYFEVVAAYGRSRWAAVVLPGSLPMFFVGLRIAASLGLLSCVAGEMVAARAGLGFRVWFAWEVMRPEELYATLLVIAIVGAGLTLAVHALHWLLLPWQRVSEGEETRR